MQKCTSEPELQGVRETVSFFFFSCSHFLTELDVKKDSCFNLRLIASFALSSVKGTPYFIPLVEVFPFFRLSVLQAVHFLACVKTPC